MPFHICPDEIIAFLMLFPFLGAGIVWVRNKWRKIKNKETT